MIGTVRRHIRPQRRLGEKIQTVQRARDTAFDAGIELLLAPSTPPILRPGKVISHRDTYFFDLKTHLSCPRWTEDKDRAGKVGGSGMSCSRLCGTGS